MNYNTTALNTARATFEAAKIKFNNASLNYTEAYNFNQRSAYDAARDELYAAECQFEIIADHVAEVEADKKFWKNRAF